MSLDSDGPRGEYFTAPGANFLLTNGVTFQSLYSMPHWSSSALLFNNLLSKPVSFDWESEAINI